MRFLKLIFLCSVINFSLSTYAEVVEVFEWKANPGKNAELVQAFIEASQIHESEGAKVGIERFDVGGVQGAYKYILRWDSLEDWGSSKGKINSSPEWAEFSQKYPDGSLGQMTASLAGVNLDTTVRASDFDNPFVYSVNVWEANPGKTQELVQNFLRAEQIIESTGARVEIYSEGVGGNGKFHYVLIYDDWQDMAKSYANLRDSTEWATFQASTVEGNAGKLVSSHSGQVIN